MEENGKKKKKQEINENIQNRWIGSIRKEEKKGKTILKGLEKRIGQLKRKPRQKRT